MINRIKNREGKKRLHCVNKIQKQRKFTVQHFE